MKKLVLLTVFCAFILTANIASAVFSKDAAPLNAEAAQKIATCVKNKINLNEIEASWTQAKAAVWVVESYEKAFACAGYSYDKTFNKAMDVYFDPDNQYNKEGPSRLAMAGFRDSITYPIAVLSNFRDTKEGQEFRKSGLFSKETLAKFDSLTSGSVIKEKAAQEHQATNEAERETAKESSSAAGASEGNLHPFKPGLYVNCVSPDSCAKQKEDFFSQVEDEDNLDWSSLLLQKDGTGWLTYAGGAQDTTIAWRQIDGTIEVLFPGNPAPTIYRIEGDKIISKGYSGADKVMIHVMTEEQLQNAG